MQDQLSLAFLVFKAIFLSVATTLAPAIARLLILHIMGFVVVAYIHVWRVQAQTRQYVPLAPQVIFFLSTPATHPVRLTLTMPPQQPALSAHHHAQSAPLPPTTALPAITTPLYSIINAIPPVLLIFSN